MTNRPDLLDEALTRPGRIELKIEIGLPDAAGRQQILQIHTAPLVRNAFLEPDVDIPELADRTKNFTGACLVSPRLDRPRSAALAGDPPVRIVKLYGRAVWPARHVRTS